MASAVATKVKGVVITSSPGPMSAASSARCSASVPLAQVMACLTPRYLAASASKACTFGPRMYWAASSVAAIAGSIWALRSRYWPARSTMGMRMASLSKRGSGNQPCGFGDALHGFEGAAAGTARHLGLSLLADAVDEIDDFAVQRIGFAKGLFLPFDGSLGCGHRIGGAPVSGQGTGLEVQRMAGLALEHAHLALALAAHAAGGDVGHTAVGKTDAGVGNVDAVGEHARTRAIHAFELAVHQRE